MHDFYTNFKKSSGSILQNKSTLSYTIGCFYFLSQALKITKIPTMIGGDFCMFGKFD